MNLRTVILAFLAARSPASFGTDVIHSRITRCGMLDTSPTVDDVKGELETLSSTKMNALVTVDVHPVTKVPTWWATDAGVKQWTLDGRISVGG